MELDLDQFRIKDKTLYLASQIKRKKNEVISR
jgi:hypothetical protein